MKKSSHSLVAAVLLVASAAVAQPMMVDPSRMSGIPRPDPQVPAGTITVRLIRGELSNRITNHEVELLDGDGKVAKTEKTNDEGRATFGGLSGGPFKARALEDGTELLSQEMMLPPNSGVRVMLVFPAGPGAPDGKGRPDKTLPAGVVVVKAEDADGKGIAGLDIVLGHARSGEDGVRELKGKTGATGEARFDGLDTKPTSGYLAEVLKNGARYAGKPFRLDDKLGVRVVIDVRPISKDLKTVQIGQGSHLILEITDDAVQVVEVWRLQNLGTDAVDLGPGGLHIPLPEKAVSAAVGPQAPPSFSVSGHEAVWKGPLPPGDTELQVMFVLAYEGDHVALYQPTPIPFTEINLVTEKIDGMTIEGKELQSEERELQGRKLTLYRGPGTPAGGAIDLMMNGLPHSNPLWRYLAAAASLLILFGFGIYAASGPPVAASAREKLEVRRDHLLEELAALDQKGDATDGKRAKKREELTDKLVKLYKEIDEVSA